MMKLRMRRDAVETRTAVKNCGACNIHGYYEVLCRQHAWLVKNCTVGRENLKEMDHYGDPEEDESILKHCLTETRYEVTD
jgi:hypothetical protein